MDFDFRRFIASILVCEVVGNIGALFTFASLSSWYDTLNFPSFTPPSSVFGPVWIFLYLLMGVSLYFVWGARLKRKQTNLAIAFFAVQLFLNVLWSYLFFGLQSPLYGFVGIMVLWIAIAGTITEFSRVSRIAGAILLPYIVWVSFAALLNFYILLLN
jgi:translocator protein